MSKLIDLADEVADALTLYDFSQSVSVTRVYAPDFNAMDGDGLILARVVPGDKHVEHGTREQMQIYPSIYVYVMTRVGATGTGIDTSAMDEMVGLMEEMEIYLMSNSIIAGSDKYTPHKIITGEPGYRMASNRRIYADWLKVEYFAFVDMLRGS